MMANSVFSPVSMRFPRGDDSFWGGVPFSQLGEAALDELQLQKLWFHHLLPARLPLLDGRWVEIVQTGWHNLAAGPDFRDAAVRWPDGTVTHGDIEIHVDGRDWARHHHGTDPDYNSLILHLVVDHPCEATLQSGLRVPCAILAPVLSEPLPALVLRLVPEADPPLIATPGRCSRYIGGMNREPLRQMLESAGSFRLASKARRWACQIERDGSTQTLWEALAEAFGYKHNSIPFKILARLCPLSHIQRMRAIQREALLFGHAGFLPRIEISSWEESNRSHARLLWTTWWTSSQGQPSTTTVPSAAWRMGQSRPANHPHRRLGALAMLAPKVNALDEALGKGDWKEARKLLQGTRHPFFSKHATLRARPAPSESLLLGEDRITDILLNIGIPWAMTHGNDASVLVADLPAPAENHKVKLARQRLLARSPCIRRKTTFGALEQQGLLHLLQHFCSSDQSNCESCPFPEHLASAGVAIPET
jgi:hypothetical protein